MMRGRLTVIALAGLIALAPPRVHADEAAQANPFGRINHFVVVYTENRSFDGVFGDFPGADGLASAKDIAPQTDFDGTVLKMLPPVRSRANEPDKRFPPGLANAPFDIAPFVPAAGKTLDMVHRFYQQQEQIHGGRNDRFAAVSDAGALVMGYYKSEGQELAALARDYVLADHFHHAAFGGSFLNHFFLICACAPKFETALPKMIAKIDPATGFLARTPASPRSTMDGGPVWENDGAVTSDFYAVNTLQPVAPPLSEKAPPDERLPPQTLPTIGERLSEKGVTWAWFADGWTDVLGGKIKPYAPPENFQPHHQPFNYFAAYAPGTKARQEHLKDGTEFMAAIASGTLPAVAFYKPVGRDTLHPGYANLSTGDAHVAGVIRAILAGPNGADTAIILTADENGGSWDHVAPPKVDRWGPGLRVPTLIASKLAKRGFVDHTVYDTTAILKTLEVRFGLAPLGARDAAAMDLRAAFSTDAAN